MEDQGKAWYLSKTIWTNLVMGVLVFAVPGMKEVVNEDVLAALFIVINIILRSVTKDKLQLK